MKSKPILFSAPMVRAILEGRKHGAETRRVYAAPLLQNTDPQHLANRITNGIKEIDENGCWIWGRTTSAGYGSMTILGSTHRVHVVAWSITRGKLVPKGMCVCHKCDNPLCVNPEHLFLGTRSDNMKDMVNKGRHGGPPPAMSGEMNPAAKLTEMEVDGIRLRLKRGDVQQKVARDYGVSQSLISSIKRGLKW